MEDFKAGLEGLRECKTAADFAVAIPKAELKRASGKAKLAELLKQREALILDAAAEDDLAKNDEDMRTLEADLRDLEMAISAAGRRHEEAATRELEGECEAQSNEAHKIVATSKVDLKEVVSLAEKLAGLLEGLDRAEVALFAKNSFIIKAGRKDLAVVRPDAEMAGKFGHPIRSFISGMVIPGYYPAAARTRHFEKITHYIKTGEVLKPPADKAA